MQTADRPAVPLAVLAAAIAFLAETWRRSGRSEPTRHRLETTARAALRATCWGTALWVAARTGAPGRAALDAIANLGAGTAAVATLVGLARVASAGGLLASHRATRSLDAATFTALLWGIAVALPAGRALFDEASLSLDPLAIDYATTTASLGTLMVLIAASWRLRVLRRLEIGVGDRAAGALALAVTAFLVAVPAAAADVAPPDRVLAAAVLGGSLACTWAATTREPTRVSAALRGVLAVMILGVPTTLMVGVAARFAPDHAGPIALGGSVLAIGVGLVARTVARPLGPEQSRWLDAIDAASRGALEPEPDAAIRAALMALRRASATPNDRPELWRLSPPEVLSVDVAGYLRVDRTAAPQSLSEIALDEPERTLREEVLQAVQVRKPEVRPLLAWFRTRDAFSATVVLDEDGPLGFLLLPRAGRTKPMTLEEARAVRLLTDRISAVLAVSSALARSRERELEARRRAEWLNQERQRLERMVAQGGERHRAFADWLARPVRSAAYSPAARMAIDEIERRSRSGPIVTLKVPPGVDAPAWAAFAHLSGARRLGPLVVVDGSSSDAHDLERWRDAVGSPITLADGGTLVLLDLPALPLPVQDELARLLGQHTTQASGSLVPSTGLVTTLREPMESLVAAGRLSRNASQNLVTDPVSLPELAERAEDLRALILAQLARTGVQYRSEPLGVEPAALQLLLDHTWPGNDWELADVLLRAARVSAGSLVTAADLAAVGFRPSPEAMPAPASGPTPTRRRPRVPRRGRRG